MTPNAPKVRTPRFEGFPSEFFAFYADLERNNSKQFWLANKARWERAVRDPMLALVDHLGEEFGPIRIFRPNRDLRFSADRSPYRTHSAATTADRATGGIGFYVEVSATGMTAGGGAMAMDGAQVRRFRIALDSEVSGSQFDTIGRDLIEQGQPLSPGAPAKLKSIPRGFDPDHPRAQFLRWKGAVVIREWPVEEWMHTPQALEKIRDVWRSAAPLVEWMAAHIACEE